MCRVLLWASWSVFLLVFILAGLALELAVHGWRLIPVALAVVITAPVAGSWWDRRLAR